MIVYNVTNTIHNCILQHDIEQILYCSKPMHKIRDFDAKEKRT